MASSKNLMAFFVSLPLSNSIHPFATSPWTRTLLSLRNFIFYNTTWIFTFTVASKWDEKFHLPLGCLVFFFGSKAILDANCTTREEIKYWTLKHDKNTRFFFFLCVGILHYSLTEKKKNNPKKPQKTNQIYKNKTCKNYFSLLSLQTTTSTKKTSFTMAYKISY